MTDLGRLGFANPCPSVLTSDKITSSKESRLKDGSGTNDTPAADPEEGPRLEPGLCRVGGLNQNHQSPSGTQYHIQVEDRGPVVDAATEISVRRVNVIVYVNYGEPNARIIHGRDHDYPDGRTAVYNRFIAGRVQALANEAREHIPKWEAREAARVKALLRRYYETKDEAAKREFVEANALYPFVFSQAFRELREERGRAAGRPATAGAPAGAPDAGPAPEEALEGAPLDVLYPLDARLRGMVIEMERLLAELAHDLERLQRAGRADDILLQSCRKVMTRARESLSGRDGSEYSDKRLEATRNSLRTTWRQVRSRIKEALGE